MNEDAGTYALLVLIQPFPSSRAAIGCIQVSAQNAHLIRARSALPHSSEIVAGVLSCVLDGMKSLEVAQPSNEVKPSDDRSVGQLRGEFAVSDSPRAQRRTWLRPTTADSARRERALRSYSFAAAATKGWSRRHMPQRPMRRGFQNATDRSVESRREESLRARSGFAVRRRAESAVGGPSQARRFARAQPFGTTHSLVCSRWSTRRAAGRVAADPPGDRLVSGECT